MDRRAWYSVTLQFIVACELGFVCCLDEVPTNATSDVSCTFSCPKERNFSSLKTILSSLKWTELNQNRSKPTGLTACCDVIHHPSNRLFGKKYVQVISNLLDTFLSAVKIHSSVIYFKKNILCVEWQTQVTDQFPIEECRFLKGQTQFCESLTQLDTFILQNLTQLLKKFQSLLELKDSLTWSLYTEPGSPSSAFLHPISLRLILISSFHPRLGLNAVSSLHIFQLRYCMSFTSPHSFLK